jgi:putative transposase
MQTRDMLPPKPPRQTEAQHWTFGATDVISPYGVDCTWDENTKTGYIFARVDDPKIKLALTFAEFDEIKDLQSFRFERNGMDPKTLKVKLDAPVSELSRVPKEELHFVKWKIRACKKFLYREGRGIPLRGKLLPGVLSALQTELDKEDKAANRKKKRKRGGRQKVVSYTLVGPKRFLEWVNAYVEQGPLALVEQYANCGSVSYYNTEELEKYYEWAQKYLSADRPSVAELFRQMETEFNGPENDGLGGLNETRKALGKEPLRIPDDDYLRRLISTFSAFDVMAARKSESEAINFFRHCSGGVPGLVRPMQRVEADEKRVDLRTLAMELGLWAPLSPELKEKAKATRVWMAAAICCTTRCITALTISPTANSQSTRMLLRMSLSDKSDMARAVGAVTPWEYRGTIENFCTDGGSSNVNEDVELDCAGLSIGFNVAQAEMPTQRGKIERALHTLDLRGIARFSGRTFNNPVVRGKYDSLARACVTVDELCALLVRFIVDEYHNTPHAGLNGEMPRMAWKRASKKYPPIAPPDGHKLRTVFGEDTTATLQASGLRVFGNWYRSGYVQKLFERLGKVEVSVRVDTENLGAISLKQPGGWWTVLGPDFMDGVCLRVWDNATESLRRQNADAAKMVKKVVLAAIAYAMKADQETRKRLLVQYRPMTGEDFARARRKLWTDVNIRDENDRPPEGPVDLLARALPVGQRAPTALEQAPEQPADPQKPVSSKPKKRPPRSQPKNETASPAAKKPTNWTIKRS